MDELRFTRRDIKAMGNGAGLGKGTYIEVVLLAGQDIPSVFKALTSHWAISRQTTFYCIAQAIIPHILTGEEYASIGKQKDDFINVSSQVISL